MYTFLLRRGNADGEYLVRTKLEGHAVGEGDVAPRPQILRVLGTVQSQTGEIEMEGVRRVAPRARIENRKGECAAREMTRPYLDFALGIDARCLPAQRILINGNDVTVGEDVLDGGSHGGEVVASEQRCCEHSPHGEVRPILGQSEAPVAYFEHVWVVPVAGTRVRFEAGLLAEGASDEELRQLLAGMENDFRDKAPVSAAQAATIILDGVRSGAWRILIGQDAALLDRLIRARPEVAYDYEELFNDAAVAEFTAAAQAAAGEPTTAT